MGLLSGTSQAPSEANTTKRRGRPPKNFGKKTEKKEKDLTHYKMCPVCKELKASGYGMTRHMRAVHQIQDVTEWKLAQVTAT